MTFLATRNKLTIEEIGVIMQERDIVHAGRSNENAALYMAATRVENKFGILRIFGISGILLKVGDAEKHIKASLPVITLDATKTEFTIG